MLDETLAIPRLPGTQAQRVFEIGQRAEPAGTQAVGSARFAARPPWRLIRLSADHVQQLVQVERLGHELHGMTLQNAGLVFAADGDDAGWAVGFGELGGGWIDVAGDGPVTGASEESGGGDLNSRPLRPERSALPS